VRFTSKLDVLEALGKSHTQKKFQKIRVGIEVTQAYPKSILTLVGQWDFRG